VTDEPGGAHGRRRRSGFMVGAGYHFSYAGLIEAFKGVSKKKRRIDTRDQAAGALHEAAKQFDDIFSETEPETPSTFGRLRAWPERETALPQEHVFGVARVAGHGSRRRTITWSAARQR
jgi:hypothetical protein